MKSRRRHDLTQREKYLGFKAAFQTISSHRTAGSHLAAYVIAFSVFEDRLSAARMLAADLKAESRPKGYSPHYTKIRYLESAGHIDSRVATQWREAGDKRNTLLHAAMWQFGAVTDKDVEGAVALARGADRLAARLKRMLNPSPAR